MSERWLAHDVEAYLTAKQRIDRNCINRQVWSALGDSLRRGGRESSTARDEAGSASPIEALEIGAGLGGLADDLLAFCLPAATVYTLLDPDEQVLRAARDRLAGRDRQVRFEHAGLFDERIDRWDGRFDLVVAHSFFDLVDLRQALLRIERLLKPGGLLYAPVTVDGGSALLPPVLDPVTEQTIVAAYHRSIDERAGADRDAAAGGHRAASVLEKQLPERGWTVIAAEPSDWQVDASSEEGRRFLRHILHFFRDSLKARPEIDPERLHAWLELRDSQLAAGALHLVVHNRDLLARFTGTAGEPPR